MTRPLGRTGADVTILGYGAMELRGLPRGPQVSDEDAGRAAQRRARRRHQPDRHLTGLRAQRGAHRQLRRPPQGRVLPRLQVRLPARGPHRHAAALPARLQRRPTSAPTWSSRCAGCAPTAWTCVQVHMSPSRQALEENRTVETLRELRREGKIRFIGMSGILPHLRRPPRDGRLRRLPDPLLGRPARPREPDRPGGGAGRGHADPRRRGARRAPRRRRTGGPGRSPSSPASASGTGRPRASRTCSTRRASRRWSSSCASPSATRACPPRSSAPPTRPTWPRNIAVAEKGPLPADLYEEAKKRLPLP